MIEITERMYCDSERIYVLLMLLRISMDESAENYERKEIPLAKFIIASCHSFLEHNQC